LLSNPFFNSDFFHFLKSLYFFTSENIGMFAFFTPISFAWKLGAFKTEIDVFRDATFSNWTVAPATAAFAVVGARALGKYFESFDGFLGATAFVVDPARNLKMLFK
jgi:hypothetical protein